MLNINKLEIEKPKRVIIEITDKCNFYCKHCFANKHDNELPIQSWINIFENISKLKIQSITITGGEPLLYNDLFKLIEKVKLRKTLLTLDTNASLINQNNLKFIEKHFKKIRVSYYGMNRSWHANTRSNALNENKFLNTLELHGNIELHPPINCSKQLFGAEIKKIIGFFFPVNESTWKHLKLAIPSTILYFIFDIFFINSPNYWFTFFIVLLIPIILIPCIFYFYTHFTKRSILPIDIMSFYISIFISFFVGFKILNYEQLGLFYNIVSIIGTCIILACYLSFTFFPPKFFLFKDPINNEYGINKD